MGVRKSAPPIAHLKTYVSKTQEHREIQLVTTADLRAATEIRMSKSPAYHLAKENQRKASPSYITHCALTQKGGPERLLVQIKQCLFSPAAVTQLLSGGILEKEVGSARVWMLSEELQGSFTASCHTSSLSLSAQPLPLSPDRSINHSVTEIVTQSACKTVWRKCERGEGVCSTADRPHLLTFLF